jgi:hypothetical protein
LLSFYALNFLGLVFLSLFYFFYIIFNNEGLPNLADLTFGTDLVRVSFDSEFSLSNFIEGEE